MATQVIAEKFRHEGFDGVVYKSLLGQGFNIALFDLEAAEIRSCELHRTEKINCEFKLDGNPWFYQA